MQHNGFINKDSWLEPFKDIIVKRHQQVQSRKEQVVSQHESLSTYATGYLYFGLHRVPGGWVFRDWVPNAIRAYLIGDFTEWKIKEDYCLHLVGKGIWELQLEENAIAHGDKYKLMVIWDSGQGERIPAWTRKVVQDPESLLFNAQVWNPSKVHEWKHDFRTGENFSPLIYEAHVGMSSEKSEIASYEHFRVNVLPRIKEAGYNTIQLMAIQEHPYYGSFGYHVSSFFAASSRFGTPEELKALVDEAHGMGMAVIMDLIHSHAVKNVLEGLGLYDGTPYQYFHDGARREHKAWDSLCFNYGKPEVIHFLLSNCKFWLEEYRFDGYRFDGITSMLYLDHGLEKDFTQYSMYYDGNQDEDAIAYLSLANQLIHEVKPHAITVAEEMSGMPGLAAPLKEMGMGFDFRLSMGTPDYWIKIIKELPDEKWDVGKIFHEVSTKRPEEKTIGYAESHDQALVGDKTIIFRLIEREMYTHMSKSSQSLVVDRGIALHKLIRLITLAASGGGYLNFMGNEFGHPEWIDFPRLGNNWSYQFARRQWSLADDPLLKYHYLADFDKALINWASRSGIFMDPYCRHIYQNTTDQVLVFGRSRYLFVFNFNPNLSFPGYGFTVDPGKYKVALSTDSQVFGGQQRVDESYVYYTTGINDESPELNQLRLYIPNRTGLVLEKIPTPSVY